MKKIITAVILTAACTGMADAAVNPRPGYIITNGNDTVKGTLDYRENSKNSLSCNFMADGSDSYTTYLPGDIAGFRLTDDGKYYISKPVRHEGALKTYFVEYLVKGEISLYLLDLTYGDFYYFENNVTGEIIEYRPSSMEEEVTEKNRSEMAKKLSPLFAMLAKSYSASHSIKLKPMEKEELVKMVKTYNDDVCGPDSPCILFEYDRKSDRHPLKMRALAGVKFYANSSDDAHLTCPFIGFGLDVYMPRTSQGLLLQGEVTAALMTDKYEDGKGYILDFYAGPAYEFQTEGKCKPFVRGGLNIDINSEGNSHILYGLYVGGGLKYSLKKGALLFGASYAYDNDFINNHNVHNINVSIGYQF